MRLISGDEIRKSAVARLQAMGMLQTTAVQVSRAVPVTAAGGGAQAPPPAADQNLTDQNLDMVRMKVLPTEPIPVRPSKPGPAVRVTLRVAQLPVESQKVSGPA
jgi:hypothetical protein